jgi:hypothetical protein
MHIEAELLLDQSRQFAGSDWLARNEPRSKKRQYLALDLVGTARTALLGYQPGDAGLLEIRLGLVVGGRETPYSSETSVTDAFSTETRRSISYLTCTASRGSKKSLS